MDRRTFVSALAVGAASSLLQGPAAAQSAPTARNVVLAHGLFADGSCWSEVIARLQPKGLHVTAVQNPLTTLPAAVEATQRVLDLQQGPTVLVVHFLRGYDYHRRRRSPQSFGPRLSRLHAPILSAQQAQAAPYVQKSRSSRTCDTSS